MGFPGVARVAWVVLGSLVCLVSGCVSKAGVPADMEYQPLKKALEINTDPKVLALGDGFSVGIKKDGTVWTWGSDSTGGLGRATRNKTDKYEPGRIEGINDAKSVVADFTVTLLRKDGSVWSWGDASYGALGYESSERIQKAPKKVPGIEDAVDIASRGGIRHVVLSNGDVWGWGSGRSGLLGRDVFDGVMLPTPIPGLKDIVRAYPGLAIDRKGVLWTYGICGLPLGRAITPAEPKSCTTPAPVQLPRRVIDAQASHSAAYALLDDGSVWSWGRNLGGLGLGAIEAHSVQLPTKIEGLSLVTHIAGSLAGAVAAIEDGRLATWGVSALEAPPSAPFARHDLASPHFIDTREATPPFQFVVGGNAVCAAIDAKGDVWYWQANRHGERGVGKVVYEAEEPRGYWATLEKSHWRYE